MIVPVPMIDIVVACVRCSDIYTVRVPRDGFDRFQKGEVIQKALPLTSPEERELLNSRICPKCWEEMFGDKD